MASRSSRWFAVAARVGGAIWPVRSGLRSRCRRRRAPPRPRGQTAGSRRCGGSEGCRRRRGVTASSATARRRRAGRERERSGRSPAASATTASPCRERHDGRAFVVRRRRDDPDVPAARAPASAADARADRRLRGHAPRGRRRTQRGATRLQGHHHDDRHAPLRGEEEGDPRRPRPRDRHREGRAQEGARDGDQAPRGVRRHVQRPERAAGGDARRDVPPRRALRGARALRRRSERGSRRDPAARDRPLQARHPRVPEVQRARRHLLLPRPRAQRLAPRRRGAAGVALARLPQPLPVPVAARSEGPRRRHGRADAAGPRRRRTGRRGACEYPTAPTR